MRPATGPGRLHGSGSQTAERPHAGLSWVFLLGVLCVVAILIGADPAAQWAQRAMCVRG